MKNRAWIAVMLTTFLVVSRAAAGWSQDADKFTYGHAFIGQMTITQTDLDGDEKDQDITIFGADAQRAYRGDAICLGLETGAVFSWDSSVRYFRASSGAEGGSASIAVEVDAFLMDYFFGGYVGVQPWPWLRLTVGAGPLVIWGLRSTDPEKSAGDEVEAETQLEFGAGLYARALVDIFISKTFGLHAGVRGTETTLSFEDDAGRADIDGWQYYLGIAFRFQ